MKIAYCARSNLHASFRIWIWFVCVLDLIFNIGIPNILFSRKCNPGVIKRITLEYFNWYVKWNRKYQCINKGLETTLSYLTYRINKRTLDMPNIAIKYCNTSLFDVLVLVVSYSILFVWHYTCVTWMKK